LVPVFGALVDWSAARRFQPAAAYAFFASAGMYVALAALGLERPLRLLPKHAAEGTLIAQVTVPTGSLATVDTAGKPPE
jgi:hypothetical protein